MTALIVFESMFGNTEAVARAVATGVGGRFTVEVVAAADAPADIDGYDLVVVGGPTHALGMPRASTRRSAREQGATGATGPGVREWLAGLARPSGPTPVATFDTRVRVRGLPGSAARAMRRRLRRLGADTSPGAASFWVGGTPGPLLDGELARAERWGASLATRVAPPARRPLASA
jgi:hypothetical protein